MRTLLIPLIAATIGTLDLRAQLPVFEFRGMWPGMGPSELVDVVERNEWTIPSYTDVAGRTHVRRLDYRQRPSLDTLTDEVLIETPGLTLDCATPRDSSCVEVTSVTARFAFGSLVSLELTSGRGQEKLFRAFATAGLREMNAYIGSTDEARAEIERFFAKYSINRTKLFEEVDILRRSGFAATASGATAPYAVRIFAARTTEKYDYHRPEKGVFLPWGLCTIEITQAPPGVIESWEATKRQLRASR
jgi:hypothetical protein